MHIDPPYYDHLPEPVEIPAGNLRLPGIVTVPPNPVGLVIFAHGSGSSRFSTRNQRVADELARAGLATLLLDLLTEPEADDRAKVFDIGLLAQRLISAVRWASFYTPTASLPVGLFGASTGAAAALVAAAQMPHAVAAVVSRGGRPDLAGDALRHVTAPTLLLVGSRDTDVLRLNAAALSLLGGVRELHIVPRATHLFEEPGTLEVVADLAQHWFLRYLPPTGAGVAGGNDSAQMSGRVR